MYTVISIAFPVFALIALGYLAGRFAWVSEHTPKGLSDFTFNLAIPAMLFRTMAVAKLPDVAPYKLWGSYLGSVAIVWLLATLHTRLVLRRPAEDAPSIAMSAAFGNIVMLGIPLALNALGPESGGPVAMILSIHTPLLWLAASVHMALASRSGETSFGQMLVALVRDLARNPIILAIVAGTCWRLTTLGIHPVGDKILIMLAQASVPAALVALGLSLVKFEIKGQTPTLVSILILKIVVMPVVAWAMATHVFHLPPVAAGVVILFAAMPTGANAFLFAVKHQRAMNSASGAVAAGTVLSTLTVIGILYALHPT